MANVPVALRSTARWRTRVRGVLYVVILGALLAGCDRCGDWWSPMRGESQSCRDQAPKPQ
jgi:hypothetical protein